MWESYLNNQNKIKKSILSINSSVNTYSLLKRNIVLFRDPFMHGLYKATNGKQQGKIMQGCTLFSQHGLCVAETKPSIINQASNSQNESKCLITLVNNTSKPSLNNDVPLRESCVRRALLFVCHSQHVVTFLLRGILMESEN